MTRAAVDCRRLNDSRVNEFVAMRADAEDASIAASRVEAQSRLDDIVELFVAGGYYRARFTSVNDFDRVLGALCWGVASCKGELDFGDVTFEETAKMGAKIKLCEFLEDALRKMRCPYDLRAHQVTGLDYDAIFPVTQWIVKKVMATREEFGDRMRSYSKFMYTRALGYEVLEDAEAMANSRCSTARRELKEEYGAKRVFRRAVGRAPPTENPSRWAKSVMMEYGYKLAGLEAFASAATAVLAASRWKRKTKASKAAGTLRGKSTAAADGEGGIAALVNKVNALAVHAPGEDDENEDDENDDDAANELSALRDLESELALVDGSDTLTNAMATSILGLSGAEILAAAEKFGDDVAAGGAVGKMLAVERKIAALERKLAVESAVADDARVRGDTARAEVEAAIGELEKVTAYNEKCVEETQKLKDAVQDETQREAVARIMGLIQRASNTKVDEKAFKAECKKRMAELKEQIERGGEHTLSADERAQIDDVAATHAREREKFEGERAMLSKRSRAVALLGRKLDDIPTRPELIQYERRFAELYDTVQGKLKETKTYFAAYNVLADTKKYLEKEISLLNSLQMQVEPAMESVAGKSSLVTALASIQDGVVANIKRVDEKLKSEQAAVDDIRDEYVEAQRQHRQYLSLVKQFKDACAREEALRAKITAARSGAANPAAATSP